MIESLIPWFCTFSNCEHISHTGRKLMTSCILDVDGLKTSLMLLPVLDDTDTTSVPSSGHHDHVTNIKLDEFGDLVSFQVQFDGVISPNQRIGIADGGPS
ncbi:hypothetical protein K1719_045391 [Acacia pycnantha]|nr:hypothetical protein K1719_045391 [Acacia pycnantha]